MGIRTPYDAYRDFEMTSIDDTDHETPYAYYSAWDR